MSFPPKSLVWPCLPKINMFSHLLALYGWVVSPSPQRAGAQCGHLTVVSPCGPGWTLCLGSVCNYLGKVFISPPLSHPSQSRNLHIFPLCSLSSLSVFHFFFAVFYFLFTCFSPDTTLQRQRTCVHTHEWKNLVHLCSSRWNVHAVFYTDQLCIWDMTLPFCPPLQH